MISRMVRRIQVSRIKTIDRPERMSQREMIKQLQSIPNWQCKIELYNNYEYSQSQGVWVDKTIERRIAADGSEVEGAAVNLLKVNYGCGGNLMEGWLNIDLYEFDAPNYRFVNLLEKHPFPGNSIQFGFSEDMLEHLNQAESIFFIGEIYRTLAPRGVMRLSFPGLEGVLNRHYSPTSETRVRQGEFEAYSFWDHVHFYSKDELAMVAKQMGFSSIDFVEYGMSKHPVLCNLDTRESQSDLNTYVELNK
jgi:predicted SAM-dependent methyltransferase